MTGPADENNDQDPAARNFEKLVGEKEDRRLAARSRGKDSAWFGLGMFGLVGWSIAIPTLLGVFLGGYLDERFPGRISWLLTFLFVGVVVGCMNAWYWIQKESKS